MSKQFDTDLPLGTILRNRHGNDNSNIWELRLESGRKRFWNIISGNWDNASGFTNRSQYEDIGWEVHYPKENNVLKLLEKIDSDV